MIFVRTERLSTCSTCSSCFKDCDILPPAERCEFVCSVLANPSFGHFNEMVEYFQMFGGDLGQQFLLCPSGRARDSTISRGSAPLVGAWRQECCERGQWPTANLLREFVPCIGVHGGQAARTERA